MTIQDEDSDEEKVSRVTDTAKVPSGERRVTVSLTVDLADGAKVTANVTSKPRPAGVLVQGVQVRANDDQFTIVLNRPAPTKGVLVTWVASEIKVNADDDDGEDSGETEWWVKWLAVGLLMLLAIGSALAAFWVTIWRRKAKPSEDHGLGLLPS
jgi:hypothetical protein